MYLWKKEKEMIEVRLDENHIKKENIIVFESRKGVLLVYRLITRNMLLFVLQ